jgi:hypothetical protein
MFSGRCGVAQSVRRRPLWVGVTHETFRLECSTSRARERAQAAGSPETGRSACRVEAGRGGEVSAGGPPSGDHGRQCVHGLPPALQIALTLRAVGGLTTAEVARAFRLPEPTMARRISRAKQRIKDSGVRFGLPPAAEWGRAARRGPARALSDLQEGVTSAPRGPSLHRVELSAEAIGWPG